MAGRIGAEQVGGWGGGTQWGGEELVGGEQTPASLAEWAASALRAKEAVARGWTGRAESWGAYTGYKPFDAPLGEDEEELEAVRRTRWIASLPLPASPLLSSPAGRVSLVAELAALAELAEQRDRGRAGAGSLPSGQGTVLRICYLKPSSGWWLLTGYPEGAAVLHQPSEWEQIIFSNCRDLYHKLPVSGERQYKSKN